MARRRGGADAPSTLRAVLEEIKTGWPPGLTVLTGGDLYHLDQAQHALIDALVPPGSTDFGLSVFSEQRVDVSVVVSAARSVGMFAEQRVVLVRDVAALEGDPEPLVSYAKDPPPASHLVVRAPDLDRRRKLHQALDKSGRKLEFAAAGPEDAPRLAGVVLELAADKHLEISRPAAMMLVEICGGDFYRIDTELNKIGTWAATGKQKSITPEMVREVGAGTAALSGWEIARALLRRDRAAALEALQQLLEAGDEPLRMLGGLAYRARAILQARAMIERGVPPARAVAAARIWGEAPGPAARGLASYTMNEVLRFPALLLEADRTLKSRSLAPRAVLGSMLERMMPVRERAVGAQPR
jgi:DNA polymerase-3 subunit delta